MTRTWLRSGTLAVAMTFAAASSYAQGPSRDEDPPSHRNSATTQKASQDEQKTFAENMFMTNMAEVQLGKMGVQQAASPEVKSFAQMMVTEHTKANEELKPIAQQLGVQAPAQLDEKHQAIADRLSKLQGAEFDKEFMKVMVQAHQEATTQIAPLAGHQSSSDPAGGADTGSTGSQATGTSGSSSATGSTSDAGSTSGGTSSSGSVGTAGSGSTRTVEQYAAKTLMSVNQHLQQARQLESSLK
jgi:putative membrane protein